MNQNSKFTALEEIITDLTKEDVAVAFSGGVDSSLLLQLCITGAQKHHTKVHAVTFVTELQPKEDISITERVCKEMGATHKVLYLDQLAIPEVKENHTDRCYHCKKELFSQLIRYAHTQQVHTVIDGTNADDMNSYRPGIRAIEELGVISPLRLAQMSKQEVRSFSKILHISVANRPSSPCLSTRFPYNTTLDSKRIEMVGKAEDFLKTFIQGNIRVRISDFHARIECEKEAFPLLLAHNDDIVSQLKALGFDFITLDLEGFRSGSMDKGQPNK